MPYLEPTLAEETMKDFKKIKTPGQLNFIITKLMIDQWKKSPKYDTIWLLEKEFVVNVEKSLLVRKLYSDLENQEITFTDVKTACANAYREFYRRVGSLYETIKMVENGDLYANVVMPLQKQLEDAIKKVEEQNKKEEKK